MSSLNKEIGGKAPSKKQINLIVTEKPHKNVGGTALILFAVLAVLAAGGLYIYSSMQTVDSLQARLWGTEDELLLLQKKSGEYDEVEEDHVRYSFAHLTAKEKKQLTGMMIIKKIEELVVPYGFVTEMSISGNTVDFTVYSEDIGLVTASLRSDPMVQKVIPKSESKKESAETITVTENVSAMIMKTIGGVQVVKRSDDPVEEETEDGAEAAEDTENEEAAADGKKAVEETETAEKESVGQTEKEPETDKDEADVQEGVLLNTESILEEGAPEVRVTIVIPPVMSTAQLRVTFRDLEENQK